MLNVYRKKKNIKKKFFSLSLSLIFLWFLWFFFPPTQKYCIHSLMGKGSVRLTLKYK